MDQDRELTSPTIRLVLIGSLNGGDCDESQPDPNRTACCWNRTNHDERKSGCVTRAAYVGAHLLNLCSRRYKYLRKRTVVEWGLPNKPDNSNWRVEGPRTCL